MIDFKEIHKKPYHFTLERLDPENENVPEAIIPDDMNLPLHSRRNADVTPFLQGTRP